MYIEDTFYLELFKANAKKGKIDLSKYNFAKEAH